MVMQPDKVFYYTSQFKYVFRLEENASVTCRGSKLTNSLGVQQHELSTRT